MSGFGLYVHWPFCAAKCPYCDFNSHVRSSVDEGGWTEAILTELSYVAELQSDDRPALQTIFFGGGTPSLMSGRAVGRVIDAAVRLWRSANDLEITMEANPASADAARFADYAKAGVGRLSLGVQALNDADLKFLGRLHNVAEARAAVALAQRTFPRISFDLIYARPNQSVAAWRDELSEALAFGAEHLSLYQLTIEPGTPFATLHRQGTLRIPEDDLGAAFYETTQEITAGAGLPAYEVSNHARPGCESRHNLLYWRYGSYAGVGPGAHGRLDLNGKRFATACECLPERWREKVMTEGHGFADISEVDRHDAAREHLLMNLRLREGIDLAVYDARWGVPLPPQRLAALTEAGLLKLEHDRLSATPQGTLLLNRVIEELTV